MVGGHVPPGCGATGNPGEPEAPPQPAPALPSGVGTSLRWTSECAELVGSGEPGELPDGGSGPGHENSEAEGSGWRRSRVRRALQVTRSRARVTGWCWPCPLTPPPLKGDSESPGPGTEQPSGRPGRFSPGPLAVTGRAGQSRTRTSCPDRSPTQSSRPASIGLWEEEHPKHPANLDFMLDPPARPSPASRFVEGAWGPAGLSTLVQWQRI